MTVKKRNSLRLQGYDYSKSGYYFVTICSFNRQELFGNISGNKMKLNNNGNIIFRKWLELPQRFKNIELDEFVIMPNHLHGIVIIDNHKTVGARSPRPDWENLNNCNFGYENKIERGDPAPTLGQIVAYFKYDTTKKINAIQNTPGNKIWQRNYYDHIIRNEKSLYEIRQYIINNPFQWGIDKENFKF